MNIKNIKITIVGLLENSTVHGISHTVKSKRKINKIMWSIVSLISSSVCCFFILESVLNYLNYEHFSHYDTVFEQPAQFFSIQFCSKDAKSFNNKSLKFGDLLKQCNFIYSDECLTHPEDYFESYNDSIYNQCYRFNSGKNIKGESVPLFSSPIGGKDDSFIMEIYAPSGLVFWVYNYTTPPRRQFKNNHNGDIQFASAGFETHVVVDRTFEFRLGYPYDDCVKNPASFQLNRTIVDFMISNNVPYSQINCLELCFDMEYLRDNPCNCKNVSLGNVWENCYGKLDNTLNTSECILNHKKAWYQQHLRKTYFDYCPLECDSMSFTVSTRILSNVFNINSTYIQAYYRTLKHTVIEQNQPLIFLIWSPM